MPIRTEELEELPDTLVDRFVAGDGMLVTGAGVSRQDIEERCGLRIAVGVPGGERLRLHLLKYIDPAPADQSLEAMATVYVMRHGRSRLNKLLRRVYGSRKLIAPHFYDLVTALPSYVRRFITTNYDAFIENALSYRNPVVVVRDVGLQEVSTNRPVVFKPHGDAREPAGCVITTPDYDVWEDTTGHLPAQLTTLFLQSTIVALGYRAQDSNLRRLLSSVNRGIQAQGGTPRTMYLMVPDPKLEDFGAYYGDEYDLVLVNTTGTEFLKWLLQRLEQRRRAFEAAALEALINPPGLTQATADAEALRPHHTPDLPAAADVPDPNWLPYAEALLQLSELQRKAGRSHEALRSRARGAQGLWLGGDLTRSTEIHEAVYREVLLERRDTRLFDAVEGTMSARDHGIGRIPEPNRYAEYLATLAEILKGFPQDPPRFLQVLQDELAGGPSSGDVALIGCMLDQLRAEHAVNHYSFADASKWFGSAAVQCGDPRAQVDLRIRQHLFDGLSVAPDAAAHAAAALSRLVVPGDLEVTRLRALGWVLVVQGDFEAGLRAFQDAASHALSDLRIVDVASTYRDIEWVFLQQPAFILSSYGPGQAAFRLEEVSDGANERATVHAILRSAEHALLDGRYREAVVAASSAQRLAYSDINPAGVFRASPLIAEAWVAALAKANDEFSMYWAAHHIAAAWNQVEFERSERWSNQLRDTLRAHAKPEALSNILAHLTQDLASKPEQSGALMLIAALKDLLNQHTVNEFISPALARAFRAGWSRTRLTDLAGAACVLLEEVYDQISEAEAFMLQSEVAQLVRSTGPRQLNKAYIALAQISSRVKDQVRNGELSGELVMKLEEMRAAGQQPEHAGSLRVALAALIPRVDIDTRDKSLDILRDEALAGRYDGVAVLAGLGFELDQVVADSYLKAHTSTVTSLTHAANPKSIGGGWQADEPRLTESAARAASDHTIAAAVKASVSLLLENRQWSVLRSTWVYFPARLVRERTKHLPEVVSALLTLARGQYSEPGDLTKFISTHPFSSIQMNIGTPHDLQGRTIVALAALWPVYNREQREVVRGTLIVALNSSDVIIREWAARAIKEGLKGIAQHLDRSQIEDKKQFSDQDASEDRKWFIESAVSALHDPSTQVREAALVALE
jgi:hypothetical protein